MNRREFFKGAAALAAVAPVLSKDALAHAAKPKPGNNPIWLMTSAFAGIPTFDGVVDEAVKLGAQGLELCVFRKDTDRADHIATHLDYKDFTPDKAKHVVDVCNEKGIRVSVGAYDNLIGGDFQEVNQNHILNLIRIAAMLGGDANDVVCGTFVGYDQKLGAEDGGFEKNLEKFKKVFTPILKYAKDLGVTVCVENCPMEGWVPASSPVCYCNLPGCLAARKLMYAILDDSSNLQETYDPSHDIWQHIDPSDVIGAMDFSKLRRVHIKGTRNFPNDAEAVNWGRLFPRQARPPTRRRRSSRQGSFYVKCSCYVRSFIVTGFRLTFPSFIGFSADLSKAYPAGPSGHTTGAVLSIVAANPWRVAPMLPVCELLHPSFSMTNGYL